MIFYFIILSYVALDSLQTKIHLTRETTVWTTGTRAKLTRPYESQNSCSSSLSVKMRLLYYLQLSLADSTSKHTIALH